MDFRDGNLPYRNSNIYKPMLSERAAKIVGSRTPEEPSNPWIAKEDRKKSLYEGTDARVPDSEKSSLKLAKTQDYIGSYYNWNGPLRPEYEMQEPMSIFDTESYVKQTINRRLSLMFRNGYEVVGRDRDVEYINSRISTMEYVTQRTFRSLMKRIMFCLFLQANCFLLKVRKEDASGVKQKSDRPIPVSAYIIIPAHQIQPIMKNGVIDKWRRYYDTGKFYDEYSPKDIIHFSIDKKPWHIFGTPRTVAVREDIFALRRIEENTELLFINYLFPLFHVTVGTELNPATYIDTGESELDLVRSQIENMPKEGVFVSDERTQVNIVGAQGQVLDFMPFITYYKARVFAGLGMSELDMGATSHGGSEKADNISQNLKDSIKADVEDFADQVKMTIFKEWLMEANYSVSVQSAMETLELTFHEIDLDNRIKEENHILNLFNNNLITFPEARKRMRMKPIVEQQELHVNRNTAWLAKVQADLDTNSQIQVLKAQKDLGVAGHDETTKKVSNGKTKMTRTLTKKTAPKAKAVQNIVTPVNQHGQNLSPKKLSDSMIGLLRANLLPAYELLSGFEDANWKSCVNDLIDKSFNEFESLQLDDSTENSYTNHLQEEISNLKDLLTDVSDLEELDSLLDYSLDDSEEDFNE